jgi:integrase
VPISSALRNYLDRYTPPPSDHDWLFPSPDGTRWDPDNFSHRALLPAQNAAGLPWTCLDFRHTFGSQLAQKGETLYKISKLMGNSPEICRKHYAALMAEDLTESVEFPKPKQDPAPDPPPADSPETPVPPAFKLHLPEAPTVSPARRTGA